MCIYIRKVFNLGGSEWRHLSRWLVGCGSVNVQQPIKAIKWRHSLRLGWTIYKCWFALSSWGRRTLLKSQSTAPDWLGVLVWTFSNQSTRVVTSFARADWLLNAQCTSDVIRSFFAHPGEGWALFRSLTEAKNGADGIHFILQQSILMSRAEFSWGGANDVT